MKQIHQIQRQELPERVPEDGGQGRIGKDQLLPLENPDPLCHVLSQMTILLFTLPQGVFGAPTLADFLLKLLMTLHDLAGTVCDQVIQLVMIVREFFLNTSTFSDVQRILDDLGDVAVVIENGIGVKLN